MALGRGPGFYLFQLNGWAQPSADLRQISKIEPPPLAFAQNSIERLPNPSHFAALRTGILPRPGRSFERPSRDRALTTRTNAKALLASVPEALAAAGVGIVPAQAWPWRRPGPRRGSRRADPTERRASRDRSAGWPPISARTRPRAISATAIAVGPATISATAIAVGPATISATASAVGPATISATASAVGPATISATASAVGPATISATASAAAAMHSAAPVHSATAVTHATAPAAAPHLRDHTVIQMGRKARSVENLDRFGLRQTKAAKRHCDETASCQIRPMHDFLPGDGGRLRPPFKRLQRTRKLPEALLPAF